MERVKRQFPELGGLGSHRPGIDESRRAMGVPHLNRHFQQESTQLSSGPRHSSAGQHGAATAQSDNVAEAFRPGRGGGIIGWSDGPGPGTRLGEPRSSTRATRSRMAWRTPWFGYPSRVRHPSSVSERSMDKSSFDAADPIVDRLADMISRALDSAQFEGIRQALAGLSEAIGAYSVNLNVNIEVFDPKRSLPLPLLTTGLCTSEGGPLTRPRAIRPPRSTWSMGRCRSSPMTVVLGAMESGTSSS